MAGRRNTKLGRNDPCPCGTGAKYKKCCLRKPSPGRVVPPQMVPPEVRAAATFMRQVQERAREREEWTRRFGHIRPCISTNAFGRKMVAAGSRIHWSDDKKPWNYVPDFLLDYIPSVFGDAWAKAELAKPEESRHPLAQWRVDTLEYLNKQPSRPDANKVVMPTGPIAAYMAFAFNLFAIEDNSRLDGVLLARLKNTDQFQGARHEVFAEATCLRAGFSIEREDESDRARRHTEFTAKHKDSGQLISVEAKSRHRPGVLGQPGVPRPYERLSRGFSRLLNDAIEKRPPHPLVVFIDTNLPYHAAKKVLGGDPLDPYKPTSIMRTILDRDRLDHGGVDRYAMLIFTNHPHHYVTSEELDPKRHILAFVPQPPQADPNSLKALFDAVELYGSIPKEFPRG